MSGRARAASHRPLGSRAHVVAWIGTVVLLIAATLAGTGPAGARGAAPSPVAGAAPAAAPLLPIHLPQPTWVNVTNVSARAPPVGYGAASAYDPVSQETVVFGGCLVHGPCPDAYTWVFQGGRWENATTPGPTPPAREYAAMDFDERAQAVLLFGGWGPGDAARGDTWTFANGTWTNVSFYSASAPPAGAGASLAYDPEPEENGSVLFGGCANVGGFDLCSNETWVWQGNAGWVELAPSLPPLARGWASMAYDPSTEQVVLFGGFLLLGDVPAATFALASGQWWNVTPTSSPAERSDAAMVDDPGRGGLILFGGFSSEGSPLADTWAYSGSGWVEETPDASPPARGDFAFALDGTGATPLLEGGQNGSASTNDTWAYEFPPSQVAGASVASAEVAAPVSFTTTVHDGTGPYTARFAFGDGADATVVGDGPTLSTGHAYAATGAYPVTVNVTDAVGAFAAPVSWSLPVTDGPSAAAQAVPSTVDPGVPVAFQGTGAGGTAPLAYAWSFGDGGRSNAEDPSHPYAAAGLYSVVLQVTDAVDATAAVDLNVSVVPEPTVSVSASSTRPAAGAEVTFVADVSGGVAPFRYAWAFGDGGTSAVPDPEHVFTGTGDYAVTLTVTDADGETAKGLVGLQAHAVPAPTFADLSGAPAWFYGGLGGIVAAGGVGALLLRRPRRPETARPG